MIETEIMEVAEEAAEELAEVVIDYALLTEPEMFEILDARLQELLVVFGNIYGLITFFTVVLLCWFVYKFFRMFF